jgi:hypothetical protein
MNRPILSNEYPQLTAYRHNQSMEKRIDGVMSRKELAEMYGMSRKQLSRKLIFYFPEEKFSNVRLFLPKQVAQIMEVFGPAEIKVDLHR